MPKLLLRGRESRLAAEHSGDGVYGKQRNDVEAYTCAMQRIGYGTI